MAYKEFVQLGVTDGYTEEDYQNFKRTALVSATSYATNAKEGCENEFALFVETEPDMYLPNLTEYITFEKGDKLNTIDISEVASIINAVKIELRVWRYIIIHIQLILYLELKTRRSLI